MTRHIDLYFIYLVNLSIYNIIHWIQFLWLRKLRILYGLAIEFRILLSKFFIHIFWNKLLWCWITLWLSNWLWIFLVLLWLGRQVYEWLMQRRHLNLLVDHGCLIVVYVCLWHEIILSLGHIMLLVWSRWCAASRWPFLVYLLLEFRQLLSQRNYSLDLLRIVRILILLNMLDYGLGWGEKHIV